MVPHQRRCIHFGMQLHTLFSKYKVPSVALMPEPLCASDYAGTARSRVVAALPALFLPSQGCPQLLPACASQQWDALSSCLVSTLSCWKGPRI